MQGSCRCTWRTLVRTFALNVPLVTMGRTPANVLPLPHPSTARAHADLRVSAEAVILTDRNSANGTFVDDVRLAPEEPVQLVNGSIIRIGPFAIRYEAMPAAAAAEPEVGPELVEERPAPPDVPPVLVTVPPAVFEPAQPAGPRTGCRCRQSRSAATWSSCQSSFTTGTSWAAF